MNNVCPAEVTGAIVPYPANGTFIVSLIMILPLLRLWMKCCQSQVLIAKHLSVLINFIQGVVIVCEKKGL